MNTWARAISFVINLGILFYLVAAAKVASSLSPWSWIVAGLWAAVMVYGAATAIRDS